jgi:hypothetical protein
VETRDETIRLLKLRHSTAIAEKATIALQIAHAAGDAEIDAKYRSPNAPAVFWAYIAATRRLYTYEACAEYKERVAEVQGQRSMQIWLTCSEEPERCGPTPSRWQRIIRRIMGSD